MKKLTFVFRVLMMSSVRKRIYRSNSNRMHINISEIKSRILPQVGKVSQKKRELFGKNFY